MRCSGVAKSPGSALRLLTMISGCRLEHHLVHLLRLPAFGIERPGDVVPKDADFAVVRHQFTDLPVDVVDKAAARGFVGSAAGAIGMMPVHQGVIEAGRKPFGAGGLDKLCDQVAPGPLFRRTVVRSVSC